MVAESGGFREERLVLCVIHVGTENEKGKGSRQRILEYLRSGKRSKEMGFRVGVIGEAQIEPGPV